jgi:hypothetical protein
MGRALMPGAEPDLVARELRRLEYGPAAELPRGLGLVRFITSTTGGVEAVLSRAKQVLARVDEYAPRRPSDDEWRRVLPAWFVARCAPELSSQEAEAALSRWRAMSPSDQREAEKQHRWPLLDWLYWLEPERRGWFWWDANASDDSHAVVAVEVQGWPFPWGALSWLLRAAGADQVAPERDDG